jgi:selenide,water dikinase
LDAVLSKLPRQQDKNVLVGFDKADDAGVYRLGPSLALVQTVDFFTPIVDDPFTFGEIAAANSLSDVYAMGGKPLSALSIVCFPGNGDIEVLGQILQGGLSKMQEAGCVVIGGHSVKDDEIKFGYSITGLIDPERVMANATAKPGDMLVLTKRLGTGVIATALKKGAVSEESIGAAIDSMRTLNRRACEVMLEVSHSAENQRVGAMGAVHSVTDITGFGLLGHAREMAVGSEVTLEIDHANVIALPGALDAIRGGHIPGGLNNNRDFVSCAVSVATSVSKEVETLLYDPQTSGGLLIAIAPEFATRLESALQSASVPASIVGRVLPRGEHPIIVK